MQRMQSTKFVGLNTNDVTFSLLLSFHAAYSRSGHVTDQQVRLPCVRKSAGGVSHRRINVLHCLWTVCVYTLSETNSKNNNENNH